MKKSNNLIIIVIIISVILIGGIILWGIFIIGNNSQTSINKTELEKSGENERERIRLEKLMEKEREREEQKLIEKKERLRQELQNIELERKKKAKELEEAANERKIEEEEIQKSDARIERIKKEAVKCVCDYNRKSPGNYCKNWNNNNKPPWCYTKEISNCGDGDDGNGKNWMRCTDEQAKKDEKLKKLMEEIEKIKKEEENLEKASPGDFCDDDNTKCISGKCGDGRCCQNWIKNYKNVKSCNYYGGVKSCHKGDRNLFGYDWNCQKLPFRPILLGSTSFSFTTFSPENNEIIKTNLMRYGPILVQIYNGKRFKDYYWDNNNKNTIYTFNPDEKNKVGNHFVVIIGYNQIIIDSQPINYWIIVNSFGEKFANNGFFAVKMEPDVIKAALYLNNSNTSGVIKTDFMKINSSNLQEATEYNSPDISFNKLYNADNTTTSDPVPTGAVPQSRSESFYSSLNSYETTYSDGISPTTCIRLANNFSWMHPSQNLYNKNFISSIQGPQGTCGCCYAFATIILLQFRVSMWHFNNSTSHTPKNIRLSIQNMLERFIPPGRDGYLYNKVCDGARMSQLIESFNAQSYDIAAEKDCPYDCKPETCGRMRQQYFCDGTSTIDLGPGDRCYINNECKSGKCKGGFCCTSSGLSNECTSCQSEKSNYPGHCNS